MVSVNFFVITLLIFILLILAVSREFLVAIRELKEQNKKLETAYQKAVSHRKSSEVRLGKIGENLAPFLKDWPYDPNNFRFLGNPIDGIQLDDDAIILIEIKTGNARLSKSQKKAKQLVKEGKVYFETFRISENGCHLRREED